MKLTLAEIAEALGTEVLGDAGLIVSGLAEPASAGPDDLALAMSEKYAGALSAGKARAAVVWPGADWQALGLAGAVPVGRPRLAIAALTRSFDPGPAWAMGIHSSALVDPSSDLAPDVSIGAFAVIGAGVAVGPGGRIGPHVTIEAGSRIGAGCLIHPGVRIGPRVRIGERFIALPNAVIGADGLSFVTAEVSAVENARHTMGDTLAARPQNWTRIHSLGGVEIGDDVEIGASSAVDSGTIRPTRVGAGCKIDNHCHIGHNCVIGAHVLMAAHVGVGGSTSVGDYCVLGGQTGVNDNITIGDRVISGGGTKIVSNVPAGRVIQGYPAVKMDSFLESYKALRRLPRLLDQLRGRQKAVSKTAESD